MIMTGVYANIRTGVNQSNMAPLQFFRGPNGSGKSACIEAITLLTAGQISDLRGRTSKEAQAVRVVKTIGSSDGISVEAMFSDGQAASASAGQSRTQISAPDDLFTDVTDLNALVNSWIDGSQESITLSFLSFLTEYGPLEWDACLAGIIEPYKVAENVLINAGEKYAMPRLAVLVSIHEQLHKSEKAAYIAEKEAENKYEVLKEAGHPCEAALTALESRRTMHKAAKDKRKRAYASLGDAAFKMAAKFDDYAELSGFEFQRMAERFGRIIVCPSLPDSFVFGKEKGWPCIVAERDDGTLIPAFHGSQGEWARLYCSVVAASLVTQRCAKKSKSASYMRYVLTDRGYDAGFCARLQDDFDAHKDLIKCQAFVCIAEGGD